MPGFCFCLIFCFFVLLSDFFWLSCFCLLSDFVWFIGLSVGVMTDQQEQLLLKQQEQHFYIKQYNFQTRDLLYNQGHRHLMQPPSPAHLRDSSFRPQSFSPEDQLRIIKRINKEEEANGLRSAVCIFHFHKCWQNVLLFTPLEPRRGEALPDRGNAGGALVF